MFLPITGNNTRAQTNTSVFEIDKKLAFNFLRRSRQRRDLVEECWEGCYYSEVKDHLRWSEESVSLSDDNKKIITCRVPFP